MEFKNIEISTKNRDNFLCYLSNEEVLKLRKAWMKNIKRK